MGTRENGRRRPKSLSKQAFRDRFDEMLANIGRTIKGKDDVVRLSLTALLADGHILFEDYPGTGKTMLARSIAQTINADVSRVQCTPDLLPSDITGSPVLDRKSGDFVFRPGPIFANVFLADEVNRATPKTQSALLEAMAERTITVDGVTHMLPEPFFVLATENPIELAGTFPLPEAQLDRFLFKLSLGYADRSDEVEVLRANRKREAIHTLQSVIGADEVTAMMEWAADVTVPEPIEFYIIDLVRATRSHPSLQLGASSRASMAIMKAARVVAAAQGRDDVHPDDVKLVAPPVLGHRLVLTPSATLQEETVEAVISEIVSSVKVPMSLAAPRQAAARPLAAAAAGPTAT